MHIHKYVIGFSLVTFSVLTFLPESEVQAQDDKKCIDVKTVDRGVCEILKKPAGGFTEERKLMKSVQVYYEYLDNVNDRINRGWREKENVRQMMKALGDGPQMVHLPVDAEKFKKGYEWDDDDVDTLNTTILGIRYMWDQVSKKCVTYLKDEKEE